MPAPEPLPDIERPEPIDLALLLLRARIKRALYAELMSAGDVVDPEILIASMTRAVEGVLSREVSPWPMRFPARGETVARTRFPAVARLDADVASEFEPPLEPLCDVWVSVTEPRRVDVSFAGLVNEPEPPRVPLIFPPPLEAPDVDVEDLFRPAPPADAPCGDRECVGAGTCLARCLGVACRA